MKVIPLFGPALELALKIRGADKAVLAEELGATDRLRVNKLVKSAVTDRINLSRCLKELFGLDAGGSPVVEQAALSALRGLRKRVNDTALAVGSPVRFVVDTNTRSSPSERHCWFTGPDLIVAQTETFTRESIADAPEEFVPSRVIASTASAMMEGKRVVRFFVSYAHDDDRLPKDFLERFQKEFAASKHYALDLWIDKGIHTGSRWKTDILKALADCEFGLLLVSVSFVTSEFITEHELPVFVPLQPGSGAKPVVPVGLDVIDFQHHDLRGLEHTQIFLHNGRFYSQCYTAVQKSEFVREVFRKVIAKLDAHYGPPPSIVDPHAENEPDKGDTLVQDDPARQLDSHLRHWAPIEATCFIRTLARPTDFSEMARTDGRTDSRYGRDALDELTDWCKKPDTPVFCAVLGEYGIGKTTTLKKFAQDLLDARVGDPSLPLPIYIDLRLRLGQPSHVPTLEDLLTEVIRRNHHLATASPLTPQEIFRLVREEGAVIIFDGLDEKIVHLTPADAQAYIRTLWGVLPATVRKADLKPGQRLGKLLISCRSHYFRDVLSQTAMLKGEDREGIRNSDYKVLLMLPFNEEQIRTYLRQITGDDTRAQVAYALLERTHNLLDLAERPVLLQHLTDHLDDLERAAMQGEVVNAALLYQRVVERWLHRDNGKHQLNPQHKRLLMERLAAKLAAEGLRELTADDLDTWLDQFLFDEPVIASTYRNRDHDVLKEDLRTATMVVRPEIGAKSGEFRFAHTSLQEFFLASHLHRALKEGKTERWDLPMQTVETLDFLGQMLQLKPDPACLRTWEQVLGGKPLRAAVLAFHLWVRAREKVYPQPNPNYVNLEGADLDEIIIRAPKIVQSFSHYPHDQTQDSESESTGLQSGHGLNPMTNLLPLQGANLRHVRFNRARLEQLDIRNADLTGAEFRQTLCQHVFADQTILDNTDFSGSQWRDSSLRGVKASTVQGHSQLIRSELPAELEEVLLGFSPQELSSAAHTGGTPPSLPRGQGLKALTTLLASVGHSSSVTCRAWSPDGQKILSGSNDRVLKIWDAQSGRCILDLAEHQKPVLACAWSPDGQKVLSASEDSTLKVWDAKNGRCLLDLSGHQQSVRACAWSPDGEKILSGSWDNTMRVWNARNGRCLLDIAGHKASVEACAWSPDGRKILSGSWDKTLKVWDAQSDRCLLILSGHSAYVRVCAWSPDGQKILSVSDDGTLKVWDAQSGLCLFTIGRHDHAKDAGWSPNGEKIFSGARVLDAESGQCLLTIGGQNVAYRAGWSRGHDCAYGAGWSPDGLKILDGTLKVRDAKNGRCLLDLAGQKPLDKSDPIPAEIKAAARGHKDRKLCRLGVQEYAVIGNNEVHACTPEAWRYLGWRWIDPQTQQIHLLPAEHFGPLTVILPDGYSV